MAVCGHFDENKYPDDEKQSKTKDVIFCGNPGAGKSTLLSCITGETFKSGVSWTKGLTKELEWKAVSILPGYRFADTPGLADPEMAKLAGAAITKAMTSAHINNHEVFLVFVVNDNAGRTRTEDLYTIRNVLDSIGVEGKRKNNLYSVIVNKMACLELPGWKEEGEPMWKSLFFTTSPSVPYPTNHIIFLPNVKELVNASNASYEFEGLGKFLLRAPSISITSVRKIETGDMLEQMKKLRKLHQEGIKKLMHKMEHDREEWQKERKEIQRREDDYRERMEKVLEERAEEIREMRKDESERAAKMSEELLMMRKEDAKRFTDMMETNNKRQQELTKQLAALNNKKPMTLWRFLGLG